MRIVCSPSTCLYRTMHFYSTRCSPLLIVGPEHKKLESELNDIRSEISTIASQAPGQGVRVRQSDVSLLSRVEQACVNGSAHFSLLCKLS